MPNYQQLKKLIKNTQIIRSPRHRLATFGSSQIHYTVVTDIPGLSDRTRLRTGEVSAEKPIIITAQTIRERFSGFGESGNAYSEWLLNQYGEAVRGLEYQFRNRPIATNIELAKPEEIIGNLTKRFDQEDSYRKAIIKSTDKAWELSLMKFIVEETLTSFSANMQELEERGFFEGDSKDINRQHREIQQLIKRARDDRQLIQELGRKLKAYGLFDQYQDDFFSLIKP